MNTASRMESTSARGAIQVSGKLQKVTETSAVLKVFHFKGSNFFPISCTTPTDDTAKLLFAAGKERWLKEREEPVHAKGKGVLRTFWLRVEDGSIASSSNIRSSQASSCDENPHLNAVGLDVVSPKSHRRKESLVPKQVTSSKSDRLVQWNADLLARHLKEIKAQRASDGNKVAATRSHIGVHDNYCGNRKILEEVQDVLELSQPNLSGIVSTINPDSIELSPDVKEQLVDYVQKIADLYHDHPFHNWGTL